MSHARRPHLVLIVGSASTWTESDVLEPLTRHRPQSKGCSACHGLIGQSERCVHHLCLRCLAAGREAHLKREREKALATGQVQQNELEAEEREQAFAAAHVKRRTRLLPLRGRR